MDQPKDHCPPSEGAESIRQAILRLIELLAERVASKIRQRTVSFAVTMSAFVVPSAAVGLPEGTSSIGGDSVAISLFELSTRSGMAWFRHLYPVGRGYDGEVRAARSLWVNRKGSHASGYSPP